MIHKVKGIYIDKRDLQLLRYLFAVKVATYQQINRDIYPGISFDRTSQRIRALEDNGLVEIARSRLILGSKRTVSLRKRSFEKLIRNGDEKRKEFKSDSIVHDIGLGDLRHLLQKSPKVVAYRTENEIQTWGGDERKLNSDAIVTIALAKRNISVPIEYERTQKGKARYGPLVKKYYSASDFPILFFVSEEQHTIDLVQEIEKKLFDWGKPKIFYALKHELLQSETPRFQNGNGTVISL